MRLHFGYFIGLLCVLHSCGSGFENPIDVAEVDYVLLKTEDLSIAGMERFVLDVYSENHVEEVSEQVAIRAVYDLLNQVQRPVQVIVWVHNSKEISSARLDTGIGKATFAVKGVWGESEGADDLSNYAVVYEKIEPF